MTTNITGGSVVATTLADLHADTVFTVSGNQILPVFDAAHDAGLRMIHMRHETAAVYAATAAAAITNRPGVALVSAGPGFLASLQGVAVARSMELPILVLSGAAPVSQRDQGAFQDLNQRAIAAEICKASVEPTSVDELGDTLHNAWTTTLAGVPGPVHVALPSDILLSPALFQRPPVTPSDDPLEVDESNRRTLDRMAGLLEEAERPAIIARPSAARTNWLWRIAGTLGIQPIVTESPRGLSDPKYSDAFSRLRECDCLLVVAPADFASAFLDPAVIGRPQHLLLVDADGDPTPRHPATLHARSSPAAALHHLADRVTKRGSHPDWAGVWVPQAPPQVDQPHNSDGVHPLAVAAIVREQLQPEDVLVLDGGEFCQWIRLGLRDVPNRVLWNGKLGAIGGSIPMALGAAITQPQGRVIAVLGDGSAGYHLSEFESALRHGASFVAIVGNDARWAAEWHMQASRYGPDRTFDTDLTFARYDIAAQGFGGNGADVTTSDDLRDALMSALSHRSATCINIRIQSLRSPAEVRH